MHKFLLDVPTSPQTECLLLRAHQPGDGPWYLATAQRNLTHLARYVTEAVKGALGFVFGPLGAHRVRLECDDTNLRSLRVAERCGFVREGHLRQNHRHADGSVSVSGTLHFGLLRAERTSTN